MVVSWEAIVRDLGSKIRGGKTVSLDELQGLKDLRGSSRLYLEPNRVSPVMPMGIDMTVPVIRMVRSIKS